MITQKDRMINALNLKMPLDYIPTFDNDFRLAEAVGRKIKYLNWSNNKNVMENIDNFLTGRSDSEKYEYSKEYLGLSLKEKEKILKEQAETYIKLAEKYEWAGITVNLGVADDRFIDEEIKIIKEIKKLSGNQYFIVANMKMGTMIIPAHSESMLINAIQLKENPEELKGRLEKLMNKSLSRARKFIDAGCDGVLETTDYSLNNGLYFPKSVMIEFVIPYLFRIIETIKKWGAYFIKDTDGDYMEIFDDVIDCKPHALSSLQRTGKMDMKIIREKTKNKVCLIGNVSNRIMQSGTIKQIEEETVRSIEELSPGGGYILATDNCIFEDIPLKNYEAMINKWREIRTCNNIKKT